VSFSDGSSGGQVRQRTCRRGASARVARWRSQAHALTPCCTGYGCTLRSVTWHGRVTQARGCWWSRELQRWLERWADAPAHVPPRRERSSRALALARRRHTRTTPCCTGYRCTLRSRGTAVSLRREAAGGRVSFSDGSSGGQVRQRTCRRGASARVARWRSQAHAYHTVLHWLRVYLALCHVARPCHSGARLLRSASATVDVAPRREHSKCTLMLAGTRVRTLRNHPGYHGTGVPCARTCLGAVSLRGPPAGGVGPRDSISLLR